MKQSAHAVAALDAADAPQAAALHAACFPEGWPAEAFAKLLALPGAFGFAVGEPGAMSGLVLARVTADEAEILTIAVRPDRRRQGIARALMAQVAARAAAGGARRLFLEVAEDNQAGRALYAALGFVAVGRRPAYYRERQGAARQALIMAAPLPGGHGPADRL